MRLLAEAKIFIHYGSVQRTPKYSVKNVYSKNVEIKLRVSTRLTSVYLY